MLTPSSDALVYNTSGVGFLISTEVEHRSKNKRGVERPELRHDVGVVLKKYPEAADCESACDEDDPFCKCSWDVHFTHKGRWGQSQNDVLTELLAKLETVGWCKKCHVATVKSSTELCHTCDLKSFLPPADEAQCPVCLDTSPANHQVPLRCRHSLCVLCARRLFFSIGEDTVPCPVCRAHQSKPSLAARLPPFTFLYALD